jgi:hypothetical protein
MCLRLEPESLERGGRLHASLNLLMPELGPPAAGIGPAEVLQALQDGFETIAEHRPAVVVLR